MNKRYNRYIEYIADDVEPPYFENMRDAYGVKAEEYRLVFAKLFNQPVVVDFYDKVVRNRKDMPLYYEDNDGYWSIKKYDEQGNLISNETSTGHWERHEYDKEGNMTYRENSSGFWARYGYDKQGNRTYYEKSDGFWYKTLFDNQGNEIYYENSDGYIVDNR